MRPSCNCSVSTNRGVWKGDQRNTCLSPRQPPEAFAVGTLIAERPRVAGGSRRPPAPTERSVQISRTTLFGCRFTELRALVAPGNEDTAWADLLDAARASAFGLLLRLLADPGHGRDKSDAGRAPPRRECRSPASRTRRRDRSPRRRGGDGAPCHSNPCEVGLVKEVVYARILWRKCFCWSSAAQWPIATTAKARRFTYDASENSRSGKNGLASGATPGRARRRRSLLDGSFNSSPQPSS
jgi:hypothetical protein